MAKLSRGVLTLWGASEWRRLSRGVFFGVRPSGAG